MDIILPSFFSNIEIQTNDWNGEYYWHIQHEGSCASLGSAIAGELTWVDTTNLFTISRGTLDRLVAYYTEAGLMVPTNDGQSAFTEAAQRVGRRHHIAGEAASFEVIDGEISVNVVPAFNVDLDKEIPF